MRSEIRRVRNAFSWLKGDLLSRDTPEKDKFIRYTSNNNLGVQLIKSNVQLKLISNEGLKGDNS